MDIYRPLERSARSLDNAFRVLTARGVRIDNATKTWAKGAYQDVSPHTPLITLTPRELGCTEHPLDCELFDSRRRYAWSKEHLGEGEVLTPPTPAQFISYLAYKKGLPPVVTAAFEIGCENRARLERVHSPDTGEEWLYAVPIKGHRWPLDRPVVFATKVADGEQGLIDVAEVPTQQSPTAVITAPLVPQPLPDTTPGHRCAQMALRSILRGHGIRDEDYERGWERELVTNVFLGRLLYEQLDWYLPWHIPRILRRFHIRARAHWWGRQDFEYKLEQAVAGGATVILVLNAQRRHREAHYQVVSGCERYGAFLYWYVTDPQFGVEEYKLPRGNVLLSTRELLRSFPSYGLKTALPGTFAITVETT